MAEASQINKHIHFVGIGGIGMSGIALILLRNGVVRVSGSDLKENKIIDELKKLGASVFIGHNAVNVEGADLVVYSSAIKENNPEIVQACRLGIPVIKRAEALAKLMQDKTVITVTGSHGKTTTSSLASLLLSEAGLRPTAAVGGILRNMETNAYAGDGKFFVAEADESDGSFLFYRPKYSIITNIDHEHLDYYGTFENELKAFKKFIDSTEESGCVFACFDDLNLRKMLQKSNFEHVLFGLTGSADIYAKNIRLGGLSSEFDCIYKNKQVGRFSLSLAGMHNISNSLSVIALGLKLGINLDVIKKTLSSYKGAGRRIEVKFENSNYLVIDDYAHHPTEIQATLKAVKDLNPKRIIAIFQPHRYTRTKLLMDKFAKCFTLADKVIITDIYAASELAIEGIDSRCICGKIKSFSPKKDVSYLAKDQLVANLLKTIQPGDLIITLGAGDIAKICDEFVEELRE